MAIFDSSSSSSRLQTQTTATEGETESGGKRRRGGKKGSCSLPLLWPDPTPSLSLSGARLKAVVPRWKPHPRCHPTGCLAFPNENAFFFEKCGNISGPPCAIPPLSLLSPHHHHLSSSSFLLHNLRQSDVPSPPPSSLESLSNRATPPVQFENNKEEREKERERERDQVLHRLCHLE